MSTYHGTIHHQTPLTASPDGSALVLRDRPYVVAGRLSSPSLLVLAAVGIAAVLMLRRMS